MMEYEYEITEVAAESIEKGTFQKVVLAKSSVKGDDLKKITITLVPIGKQPQLSFHYNYATRDEVKNYVPEMGLNILEAMLHEGFLEAYLFCTDQELQHKRSVKGKVTCFTKRTTQRVKIKTSHDKDKNYFIPQDANFLKALGISSSNGKVHQQHFSKYKQINKYVEIISHLLKDLQSKDWNIVDMGAGKGYLTFALYQFLKKEYNWSGQLIGVELRENLVKQCNQVAQKVQFKDLKFEAKDIADYTAEDIDILIALHACDTATDLAIAKGIKSEAEIIVTAPCCHKQIRKQMTPKTELAPILKYGILKERQAEMITDGIRALILQLHGYKTKVFEFISTEHTAKNVMVIGTKHTQAVDKVKIQAEIDAIKTAYGIEWHALEKELGLL